MSRGGRPAATRLTQERDPCDVFSSSSSWCSYREVIYSISLASPEAPDDDYRASVEAVRNIR